MHPASENAPEPFPACVSVVIPTRNRPRMVCAAVRSAFAQTTPPLEVIVVVDGPEEPSTAGDSASALADLGLPGLRVLALAAPVGGAEARNLGVQAARGEWIAFLDDDDTWLEAKLARQLAAAANTGPQQEPVIACRVVARAPGWEETWPRRNYMPGEPVAEYLFCRRGWRYGDALLQTSTLLARRRLLLRVPFASGLSRHQDWDWLLRVTAEVDVTLRCLGGEPLVVFHVEGGRPSVSRTRDWRWSAAWAHGHAHRFSRRAMRGFLATECAAQAQDAALPEKLRVFWRIFRLGPFAARDFVRAAAFLLVPQQGRRRLRDALRASFCAAAPIAGRSPSI